MLKALRFIFIMEIIVRFRQTHEWLYPLAFFLVLILLFPFAITIDPTYLPSFFVGYAWLSALLASLLSIQSIFLTDMEEGYLEQLVVCAIPLPLLILIKLTAQWLVTILPFIVLMPILGNLFHLSSVAILVLMMSLILGSPILIFIGSLGAALTQGLKQAGVLLSVLILPLVLPVLIFGINLVKQASLGIAIGGPCFMLAGFTILSISLLPFAIAAALQFALED